MSKSKNKFDEVSRRKFLVGTGVAAAGSALGTGLFTGCSSGAGRITLEVLNPRGEVDPPPVQPPNKRLDTMDGKTIGIFWNGKENGYVFWDHVQVLLERKYPTVKVLRYNGAFEISDAAAKQMVADGVQAFMYGMGD